MSKKFFKSVLVIAPHCDDEMLAAGGMIQTHIKHGARVRVVLLTNGDGQYRHTFMTPHEKIGLGERRQRESLNALAHIGVSRENVTFLSYPDRGLNRLWNEFWDCEKLYRSPRTGKDHSVYKRSFTPGAPYCGMAVVKDLKQILLKYQPNIVVMPHPNDLHMDHWAANAFTLYAIEKIKREYPRNQNLKQTKLLTYIVHFGRWPMPRGKYLKANLEPPKPLLQLDTRWLREELEPAMIAKKLESIKLYKSQFEFMSRYMESFARRNELFGIVPTLTLGEHTRLVGGSHGDLGELLSNPNELSEDEFPLVSYHGLQRPGLLAKLRPYSSIKTVSVERDKNQITVGVEFRGRMLLLNKMMIHIKPVSAADNNDTFRFVYMRRRLYVNNSDITTDKRFSLKFKNGKYFALTIPLRYLHSPDNILLGVELIKNEIIFDKSAYRLIILK